MEREVSIIIPVYNAISYLERCVESIVYGEYKNLEVILIEDCSKDGSWLLCQTLAERFDNVSCYQNEKNSGVSYTRNHGLKKAKGKYIVFVDSDDWVSGRYVTALYETINQNVDKLVICGLHFIDKVSNYRRTYLWDTNIGNRYIVERERFFELVDHFLIQQLWNKIFVREIIEENNVLFDESQSMGEDFQFVLDYMEAANIKKGIIINEPLYYYLRHNSNSLMSKFGIIENQNEFKRLEKLRGICGAINSNVESSYQKAVHNLKNNYVYQISRNNTLSKSEKILAIERIMNDEKAEIHLNQQKKIMIKENAVRQIQKYKLLPERIINRVHREKNNYIIKRTRKNVDNTDVSIISQNCIGGVFYHDMKQEFLSPTINLFFKAADFVKLVKNLKYYMEQDLIMTWGEEYPVGLLDDIKVFFMHYETCYEAKELWNKRKQRINWDKIIVLSTDMEGFDDAIWTEWRDISYPKLLFSVVDRQEDTVVFYKYKQYGHVQDLIPKREFYQDETLIKKINAV